MAVINADGLVLGRMATIVAERLLKSETIEIINAEKAVITGNKVQLIAKFKKRLDARIKGNPQKGPKYSRMPDRVVRRAVRGMLPFKKRRGREAFKNLKVHISVPKGLRETEAETPGSARNTLSKGFMTVGGLSRSLGAKF